MVATVIYTEDLQHPQLIDGSLRIVNPFLNLAMEKEIDSIQ
jgi:predicted nucleic acid-binding protein